LPGDIVVQDADARAGAHGLRLARRAGNLEAGIPASHDLSGEIERGGEDQVLHIADPPVRLEVLHGFRRAVLRKVAARGIEAERVVRELGGDEASLLGPLQRDGDVRLALRQREGARHRHELDLQLGMARRQPAEAGREEGDAEAVRRADAHGAGDGRVDAADARLRRQHLRLHALGRGQEGLALRGEVAAVCAADEKARLQRRLQRADAAAEGRVVDAEPAGGGEQLPRAGNGEEHAHVVPVHGRLRL
jgi:hypothetical protein